MGAIKAPANRRWNLYLEKMNRACFKKRLEKAAQGELYPPEELKSLRGNDVLFEIRWSQGEISVNEVNRVGIPVEVRLIHAQPSDQLGRCILGLHAHEKVIVNGDPVATKTLRLTKLSVASPLDIPQTGVSSGAHNMTEVCITPSHTYIV